MARRSSWGSTSPGSSRPGLGNSVRGPSSARETEQRAHGRALRGDQRKPSGTSPRCGSSLTGAFAVAPEGSRQDTMTCEPAGSVLCSSGEYLPTATTLLPRCPAPEGPRRAGANDGRSFANQGEIRVLRMTPAHPNAQPSNRVAVRCNGETAEQADLAFFAEQAQLACLGAGQGASPSVGDSEASVSSCPPENLAVNT